MFRTTNVPPHRHLYPFHHVEIDDTHRGLISEWRAIAAELIGTLLFVFVSTAVAIATNTFFYPDGDDDYPRRFAFSLMPIALANGLTFGALVWSLYHLSGAHLNPAITWGALITRRIGIMRGVAYILAQVVGAILGALLAAAATPTAYHGRLGSHFWDETLSNFNGFLLELMLTLILVFVVFATMFDPVTTGRHAAWGIGSIVAIGYLCGWPFVGPPMNPARALGTAIAYGTYDHMWVYWLGPLAGATLAALLYTVFFLTRTIATTTTTSPFVEEKPAATVAPTVPTEHTHLLPTGVASI
jgi:MIP family channel proteins